MNETDIIAYVLINTVAGKEDSVIEEIKKMDKVKESYMTFGVYDILVKIEGPDMLKIKDVENKIRIIQGVKQTLGLYERT